MAHKIYRRTLDVAGLSVQRRAEGEEQEGRPVVLSGYAVRYDEPTDLYDSPTYRVTEVIRPGARRNAVAEGQDVRFLVDHNSSLLLGRTKSGTLTLRDDPEGLYFEVTLPDTSVARDLAENIRLGNINQCSFAFRSRDGGEKSTTRTEGPKTIVEVEIADVDLYDVSAVTYPAYQTTSIEIASRSADLLQAAQKTALVERCQARLRALKDKS